MFPSPIPGQTPVYEDYARCIHCGLCLNACPTYRLWNLEADSPRGRIHQMIHVELDQQPITDSFVDHIDKCLDCRACETACLCLVFAARYIAAQKFWAMQDAPHPPSGHPLPSAGRGMG